MKRAERFLLLFYFIPRAVFFCFSQTKYLCILFRYNILFKVARRFLFCLIDSVAAAVDAFNRSWDKRISLRHGVGIHYYNNIIQVLCKHSLSAAVKFRHSLTDTIYMMRSCISNNTQRYCLRICILCQREIFFF